MADSFKGLSSALADPGTRDTPIEPDDDADLPEVPRFIYVGATGDIAMIGRDAGADAEPTIWPAVPVGIHPFRPRRVMETGTTATGLIAVF